MGYLMSAGSYFTEFKITTTAMATGTCTYNSLYISLPSSPKQQHEMNNSALPEEREPRGVIF